MRTRSALTHVTIARKLPLAIACLFLAGPALFSCGAATAGTIMQLVDKNLSDPKDKGDTQVLSFQDGSFRSEEVQADGSGAITIYRDETIYMLEPAKKRYRRINKAQMEAVGGQLADLRNKMEAQMAKMTPEQRAMMEQAMSRIGGATASAAVKKAPAIASRDTGRSDAAAGVACRVWEITVGGSDRHEVCVAAPAAIPGGTELVKVMQQMGEFVQGVTQGLGGAGGMGWWTELTKINGVPIVTRDFDSAGKPDSETRLMAVKSQSLPPATFAVPDGYTERKMNIGAGGGGGDD